jgi:plastocyanin
MKHLALFFCLGACVASIACSPAKTNTETNKPETSDISADNQTDSKSPAESSTSTAAKPAYVNQEGEWGHLTGRFVFTGDVPPAAPEDINKDQDTCLAGGEPPLDDNLLVGEDGALKDVFVMMYLKGSDPPAVHPSYEEAKNEPVVIDNVKCRFVPHALFVRTGQTFRMKNSDDVGHNCHVKTFANEKNVNVPVNDHVDTTFEEVDSSPGPVGCDVHPWMDAVMIVRDEPYVAISAEDGSFRIENIPAGEWKFQFWHKKFAYMRKLEVEGYDVGRKGEISLTIADGETLELGNMSIDAEHIRD